MTLVLEADGLWKSYHVGVRGCSARVSVLCGVRLVIHRGERVGIIGRPGSGKTTLLHCLAGLRRPDRGQIRLPDGARSIALLDDGTPVGEGRGAGTTLIVARELGVLQDQVDRLLLLRDGRLVTVGPPSANRTRRVAESAGARRDGPGVR